MQVKVTAENIDRGTRTNPYNCPVARALIDAGFIHPRVSNFFAEVEVINNDAKSAFYRCQEKKEIRLSDEVVRFIKDFDNRIPVEPFNFELKF